MAPGTGQLVTAQTGARIGDLIVVLDERHEDCWLQPKCWRATTLPLPFITLSLVEVSPFERRDELLGRARIVGVISLPTPRHGHHSAVMKVIVPQGIQTITPLLWRSHELRLLRLILRDEENRASASSFAHLPGDGGEDVVGGGIIDVLGGIEAQAIEMELVDPIRGVGDEELTDRTGERAVEVDRLAPIRGIAVREILCRVLFEIVSIWPDMIIDHVEDHPQPHG